METSKKLSSQKWILASAAGILTTLLVIIMALYLPPAIDWHEYFRPAALELAHGRSPYSVFGFYHAPWGLLPIIPIAVLPETIGRAILVICGLVSYAFVAHRMGAKPIAIVVLLLSPPVFHELLNGNLDWLAVIGFVVPPPLGLFFIAIKPQIGIAVAPFWLIQAWKQGGFKKVIFTFAPFTIALILSFVLWGFWPLTALHVSSQEWWNASLWPLSIPVGVTLFVTAIRKQRIEYAMAASPCLSPYVLFHSWIGVLLAIVASLPETIAAVIGLWILIIIRGMS